MAKRKKTKKLHAVLVVIIAVILFLSAFTGGAYGFYVLNMPHDSDVFVSGDVEIHFPELGNRNTGDFVYIKIGDIDILIDGGSKVSSIPTISEYVNERLTDDIIEYVIVTHAHEDHYAGYATPIATKSLFDLYTVETIIDFPQTSSGKTEQKMYQNYIRERDEEIAAGAIHYTAKELIDNNMAIIELTPGITLEVLNSYYYHTAASNENNNSVCVMLSQGDKHFLFTGDLEKDGEEKLIEMNDLPEVELYKAGHHGSNTSSNESFLAVIKPKFVVVCCVAGSDEYGAAAANTFPTQNVVDRLFVYTDQIFITSLCVDYKNNKYTSYNGNIIVKSNIKETTVTGSNHSLPIKETDWYKQNRAG